jgi:ATP-binding cassette subfamily F protein 3
VPVAEIKKAAAVNTAEARQAQKEQERRVRKTKNEIEKVEQVIAAHEHKIAEMDAILANPGAQPVDDAFFTDYQKEKTALERKLYEWELLMEQAN